MVIYHIYPLGLCNCLFDNKGEETKGNRILSILKWIPHIKDMGIDCVYFGPIFESGYHGYDTYDYYRIDSRLGSNDDFKVVCKELKRNGIKIILDGVFNHVGRGFWAFKDLMQYRENSYHCGWFMGLNFNNNNDQNDHFSYDTWNGYTSLVKLNLRNPYVVEHLLNAVNMWIDEFEIDGLRLDAADVMDLEFFNKLKDFTKKKKDFLLIGEIVKGDYTRFLNYLDSTTNYALYKSLYSAFNSKNMFEFAHGVSREFGPYGLYKNKMLYNFVDNHDVNRIASVVNDSNDLFNIYTLLFTIPGIPSIYYGSEWGIKGEKSNGSDDALRPFLEVIPNNDLTDHIKNLIHIKNSSKALMFGSYDELMIKNEQYAFARKYEDETKIVIVNASNNDFDFHYDQHFITVKGKSSVII